MMDLLEAVEIYKEFGFLEESISDIVENFDQSKTMNLDHIFSNSSIINEGLIKRIKEVINTRNWKKRCREKDLDALNMAVTPYVRKVVTSKSQLDTFYRNNDYFIECVEGDEAFCQLVANLLASSYDINTPVNIYVVSGPTMNKVYDLHDMNSYHKSVHHMIVPLETLKNTKDIVPAKMTIKARYFNDVVDNNEYREYIAGRHEYTPQIQWLIDHYK